MSRDVADHESPGGATHPALDQVAIKTNGMYQAAAHLVDGQPGLHGSFLALFQHAYEIAWVVPDDRPGPLLYLVAASFLVGALDLPCSVLGRLPLIENRGCDA